MNEIVSNAPAYLREIERKRNDSMEEGRIQRALAARSAPMRDPRGWLWRVWGFHFRWAGTPVVPKPR
jgi:hypothetical protein